MAAEVSAQRRPYGAAGAGGPPLHRHRGQAAGGAVFKTTISDFSNSAVRQIPRPFPVTLVAPLFSRRWGYVDFIKNLHSVF